MKTKLNFDSVKHLLDEPIKIKPTYKKNFFTKDIIFKEKDFKELEDQIEFLEDDLRELRNFIKVQKKLQSLTLQKEFSFDSYIKVQSEAEYDEEFERVRDEFEKIILEENKSRE